MDDRHRDVALFHYSLIREAADPALTKADRGRLVRALAAREQTGPGGVRVRVARNTLDRWIRGWRAGGFEALVPAARTAEPTTPLAVLDLAVKLKREAPRRTAAQLAEVILAAEGWAPSESTIQRLFARLGLHTRPDGTPPEEAGLRRFLGLDPIEVRVEGGDLVSDQLASPDAPHDHVRAERLSGDIDDLPIHVADDDTTPRSDELEFLGCRRRR